MPWQKSNIEGILKSFQPYYEENDWKICNFYAIPYVHPKVQYTWLIASQASLTLETINPFLIEQRYFQNSWYITKILRKPRITQGLFCDPQVQLIWLIASQASLTHKTSCVNVGWPRDNFVILSKANFNTFKVWDPLFFKVQVAVFFLMNKYQICDDSFSFLE